MSPPDELLLLRLGLLALLLLFVLVVALSMRGPLRVREILGTGSGAGRRRASLTILAPAESGVRPGTVYELAGVMTIGRDPECSIILPDSSVSGSHAVVRVLRGAWVVADNGSTNGTFVNNQAVDGNGVWLRGGERITVGAVVLEFQS